VLCDRPTSVDGLFWPKIFIDTATCTPGIFAKNYSRQGGAGGSESSADAGTGVREFHIDCSHAVRRVRANASFDYAFSSGERRMRRASLPCLAAWLAASSAGAATILVTPSDSFDKIESASAGDEVVIAPGRYALVFLTTRRTRQLP
jgi:hypothetical protein